MVKFSIKFIIIIIIIIIIVIIIIIIIILLLVFNLTPFKIDQNKIETVQEIKYRIWEKKGGKHAKPLAKI